MNRIDLIIDALEQYVNVVVSHNDLNNFSVRVKDAGAPARRALAAARELRALEPVLCRASMTDREIMQQALEGLRSAEVLLTLRYKSKWIGIKAISALEAVLSQPEPDVPLTNEGKTKQEPVTPAIIAGVLFDLMGWLTSRQERLVLSASDEASPAVKVIEEFAKMRGLSLDDAKVKDWQEALAQPEQAFVPFPSFMRKRIEQAMEDAINPKGIIEQAMEYAINPKGMSVHDGKANVLASDLHRMLLVIDSAPPRKPWVGLTDEERNEMIGRIQHDQFTKQRDLIGSTQIITEMYLKGRNT